MMSLLINFLREAGWPVYPVLGSGLAALTTAVGYSRHPSEARGALVRGLGIVTLLLGVFGSVLGLQHCISCCEKLHPEAYYLLVNGLGETLNVLDAALFLLIPTCLLYTVANRGTRRGCGSAAMISKKPCGAAA